MRTRLSFDSEAIEMAHGAGGVASRRLVEGLLLPAFDNPILDALGDAAVADVGQERLAFTSDGFVVRPLAFPGGSIGALAVHGTVNDLAVAGARPESLLLNLIVEAGLPAEILKREIAAAAAAARRVGVPIAGGDTKVVEQGKADGMYITTAGLGRVHPRARLGANRVVAGDRLLLSGPIGDHGITILLARGELELEADLRSDTRSVQPLVLSLLDEVGPGVHWMRDPTRGGLATALNELAGAADIGIALDEAALPVRDTVRGACELLGLDPLHIANEGQFVAVVARDAAAAALQAVQAAPGGADACFVGEVVADPRGTVVCRPAFGGARVVDMLVGDPLPRIC